MKNDNTTRRDFFQITAIGAGAAALLTGSSRGAFAYQGNMERALAELQTALQSLREATPDKGGHKATAVRLIEQAMGEVQAGIDFAARKFGD
jgi:anaerobic selenocysteine-containing dehydrogenase